MPTRCTRVTNVVETVPQLRSSLYDGPTRRGEIGRSRDETRPFHQGFRHAFRCATKSLGIDGIRLGPGFVSLGVECLLREWKALADYIAGLVAHSDSRRTPKRSTSDHFVDGIRFRNRILTRRSFDTLVNWCRSTRGGYFRRAQRVAATFLQLKRAFPELPLACAQKALKEHRDLLSKPFANDLPYDIVDDIVETYFPRNWGHRYVFRNVHNLPNTSIRGGHTVRNPSGNCSDVYPSIPKGSFFPLAEEAARKVYDDWYCLLARREVDDYGVEAVPVPDAGKIRVITKARRELKVLQPLQKALQRHLTTFPEFQFTGESFALNNVRNKRIWTVGGKGGRFLSVDYKSATDSVDGTFMSSLITRIIDRSGSDYMEMLRGIAEMECQLGRRIDYPTIGGCSVVQRRGSLMGSLLSFPLLCLWNASILKRAVGHRDFLVNGDDALVRCSRGDARDWAILSSRLGVEPSSGKVYWSDRFATFCSRYFHFDRRLREAVTIDAVPVALMNAEATGEDFNTIPVRYATCYKRWCSFRRHEWRPLKGPRALGGLGGRIDHGGRFSGKDRCALLKANYALRATSVSLLMSRFREKFDSGYMNPSLSWLRPSLGFCPTTTRLPRPLRSSARVFSFCGHWHERQRCRNEFDSREASASQVGLRTVLKNAPRKTRKNFTRQKSSRAA